MKKEAIFFVTIVLALFIMTGNHVGRSLGDAIFETLGISPWTEDGRSGLHLPVLIGFALLIVGIIGAVKFYKPRYPKIISRIIYGCLLFIFFYPWVAEKSMVLMLHNATGFRSIDYVKKDSHCSFQSEGNKVTANCSFTIYNYGRVNEITIKPILSDDYGIRFEAKKITIRRHEKNNFGTYFEGIQKEATGFNGSHWQVGAEIELHGITKPFE